MKKIILIFLVSLLLFSCKKYLDKKPDTHLAVPTSIDDFQRLLDNQNIIDYAYSGVIDLGCDDYWLDDATYQSLPDYYQNIYTWASDSWLGNPSGDWNDAYANIYVCNVAIEGLKKFKVNNPGDQATWNSIYGRALFIRALETYSLEETFGQPFKPSTANTDLGVPLKLTTDPAIIAVRSTVQAVFAQITSDLNAAKDLLPVTNAPGNRPQKTSALGLLARVYLTMQDYTNAGSAANAALQLQSTLQDYNDPSLGIVGVNSLNPFPSPPNDFVEVLYPTYAENYGIINYPGINIDSTLYQSYDINDWRQGIFFTVDPSTNYIYFKGFYSGNNDRPFSGPATDEMYLTRAECYARANNKGAALTDLNALLIKRWQTGTFTPVTAIDADDALRKILIERRKELIFRCIRWADLRRLNQDPRFAVTLKRIVNGTTYTLAPNDKKYTYPIPLNEIKASGIPQNPR